MIRRIATAGFRRWDRDVELGALTFLRGPNGSGKTSVLQAIQVAVLGYLPRLGVKAPATTIGLARSRDPAPRALSISLETERSAYLLTLESDPAGSIRWTGRVGPAHGEGGSVTKIRARLGTEIGSDPVLLDLAEFSRLSGPDRRRRLLELCQAGGGILPEGDPLELVLHGVPGLLQPGVRAELTGLARPGPDLLGWTERILEAVKGHVQDQDQRRRDAESALGRLPVSPGVDPAAIDQARLNLAYTGEQLATARADLAQGEARARDIATRADWIEQAGRRLQAATARRDGIVLPPETPQEIAGSIAELEAQIQGKRTAYRAAESQRIAVAGAAVARQDLERRLAALRQEVADQDARIIAIQDLDLAEQKVEETIAADDGMLAELATQLDQAVQDRRGREIQVAGLVVEKRLTERMTSILGSEDAIDHDCPIVASLVDLLGDRSIPAIDADLARIARGPDPKVRQAIEQQIDEITERRETRRNELADIRANIRSTEADYDRIERQNLPEQVARLEAELAAMPVPVVQDPDTTPDVGADQLEAELGELVRLDVMVRNLHRDREEAIRAIDQATEEIQRYERERHELVGSAPDVDRTRLRIEGLEAQQTDQGAELDRLLDAQGQAQQRGLEQERLDAAVQRLEALRALGKAVGPAGLQGRILRGLMAPLSARVAPILAATWPEATFGIQLVSPEGRQTSDIGVELPGIGFVSLEALSQGEAAIVGAAVTAGMVAISGAPLKFLAVDNINDVDELDGAGGWPAQRRSQLMAALADAVDRRDLDQVVVAGITDPSDDVLARYRVHDFGTSDPTIDATDGQQADMFAPQSTTTAAPRARRRRQETTA